MHHALACSSSDIETYIVAGGFFCFLDHPLAVPDQFEYRTFFLTGHVKKILHMAEHFHPPRLRHYLARPSDVLYDMRPGQEGDVERR